MSTEFGADTTLDEVGLPERAAARVMSLWLPAFSALVGGGIRFDRQHLRIALHGESERPGDGFSRGQITAALWMCNVLVAMLPLALAGAPAPPESPALSIALALGIAVTGLFALLIGLGSAELISETQLIDHTVPEQPEKLDELQEEFVNGDLGRGEFESEVERVIER